MPAARDRTDASATGESMNEDAEGRTMYAGFYRIEIIIINEGNEE